MTNSQNVDIKALSALARLEVSDEDMKKLEEQIPAILAFVASIQEVSADIPKEPKVPAHHNVMREDTDSHETGLYTEALLKAAPQSEKGYVKVKQVLKGGKHA